jgi:hypothetical protein
VKLPSKMKKNTLKVIILSFTLPIFLINRFWQLVNKIKSRLPKKKKRYERTHSAIVNITFSSFFVNNFDNNLIVI